MPKIMPSISKEFVELEVPPFNPYVYIQTVGKFPTSISAAAWSGNMMKYLDCEKLPELPGVQKFVKAHYIENEGGCALYGAITGFIFVFAPNRGTLLDIEGNVLGSVTGKFWPQGLDVEMTPDAVD